VINLLRLSKVKEVIHMVIYVHIKFTASQCELKPQSSHLNAEELMSPKQKNQSTSPNLPITENTINDDEVSV